MRVGCPVPRHPPTSARPLGSQPTYDPEEWFTHESDEFTVQPGEERFLCYCYSVTLEEDLVSTEIRLDSLPVVHHVVNSRTSTRDPDGFFECDVLLQTNWTPIFIAGTGDASLVTPEGSGYILKKGTQLTMQLHLLNAAIEPVSASLPIRLRRVDSVEHPVQVAIVGTAALILPPAQPSDAIGQCQNDESMRLFAAFPPMHYLGTKMVVEVGKDPDALQQVFVSDPYDFDNQELSTLDVALEPDDYVRVTCSYDNIYDQLVTFGESSTHEMCFFMGFVVGTDNPLPGCLGDGGDNTFVPEACGSDPPNELSLGAACTPGGGECQNGFVCTQDLDFDAFGGLSICIGIGCSSSEDCGGGDAVCCSLGGVGIDISLCLPPSCTLEQCELLP